MTTPSRAPSPALRYALIAVDIGAALALGWLAATSVIELAVVALAMALAVLGLIQRQAWAANVSSVVAFLSMLGIALVWIAKDTWDTQPDTHADPAGPWFLGAFVVAMVVGVLGLAVGGDLRRERRERAAE